MVLQKCWEAQNDNCSELKMGNHTAIVRSGNSVHTKNLNVEFDTFNRDPRQLILHTPGAQQGGAQQGTFSILYTNGTRDPHGAKVVVPGDDTYTIYCETKKGHRKNFTYKGDSGFYCDSGLFDGLAPQGDWSIPIYDLNQEGGGHHIHVPVGHRIYWQGTDDTDDTCTQVKGDGKDIMKCGMQKNRRMQVCDNDYYAKGAFCAIASAGGDPQQLPQQLQLHCDEGHWADVELQKGSDFKGKRCSK